MKKSIKTLIIILFLAPALSLYGDNWTYSEDVKKAPVTEGCINCGKSYKSQINDPKPLITSQDPWESDKKHTPRGFTFSTVNPAFLIPL